MPAFLSGLFYKGIGIGEVPQWVKHLLYQHADVRSDPQHLHMTWAVTHHL